MKKKCDFIISAFGSGLFDKDIKDSMSPVKMNKWGTPEVQLRLLSRLQTNSFINLSKVDMLTMKTSENGVFCGGDLAGSADTAVEAANDGKIASWEMHR